jgi:hypothetical protein
MKRDRENCVLSGRAVLPPPAGKFKDKKPHVHPARSSSPPAPVESRQIVTAPPASRHGPEKQQKTHGHNNLGG